jgi:DNA-binding NarL/FixJ family response regulator
MFGVLTPAEVDVVQAVLRGWSLARIAALRARSPRTIANQIRSAYRKLGVQSRLELAVRCSHESQGVGDRGPCVDWSILDERERQVLSLRSRACALKCIAFELGLSTASVSRALASGMRKLGLASCMDLCTREAAH